MEVSTVLTAPRQHLRWMDYNDIDAVIKIENRSFGFPWTADNLLQRLEDSNVIAKVCVYERDIAGYIIYDARDSHVEIISLAVDKKYQRLGFATQMVSRLAALLKNTKRERVDTLVSEMNLPAQLFFRSLGFAVEEILHTPYEEHDDDGYLFVFRPGK